MRRSSARLARNVALLLCMLGTGTVASLVRADAAAEKDAKKLQSDAMDVDFLSLDYKAAKKKLEDAIKRCGTAQCSAAITAGLHRDKGVVLVMLKDNAGGTKEFDAAIALDPNGDMSKDLLANAQVKKLWEASKKAAGVTTAPTASTTTAPTTTGTGTKPPPVNAEAEGNMTIAVKIAPVGFVLPVVIDTPEGEDIDTVKFSYKTVSMEKYKTLDAKKESGKFVTKVDCTDTQFQGDIKYYVRGYDGDKNEVDHYGTLKKPGVIKLVDKLPDDIEAPTFPGGKEPEKCVDKGDCQPGFPCDKNANLKPEGSGCSEDQECQPGLSCVINDNGSKWCHDTGAGGGGGGGKGAKGPPKLWIGADFQLDMLFIGGDSDICKQTTWACTKDGVDFGVKDSLGDDGVTVTGTDVVKPDGAGKTSGGPAVGTMRGFISIDYFVMGNLTIGGRLGYAFRGNNSTNAKFLPFHAEARAQYFFGALDPKTGTGLRPYIMAAGGLAEFDAAVPGISVVANQGAKNDADCGGRACIRDVKAYRLAGQGFAAIGGGLWFNLTPNLVRNANLTILLPLPTFSLGLAPEIGLKFGL